MSISKKILLVSLLATGSFYAHSKSEPAITEKTVINRVATEYEKKLADAQAQQQLTGMNKPFLQLIGEDLEKNMNYLYNVQSFGVKHGLVKGAGIVVGLIGLAYLHKLYANYCFHQLQKSKKSE
ncbi:hypothetical protein KBB68_03025 [Candidatus Babeliales bacterium]|nr:hypothetical protein [Candidatus Babeliales bacterium]